MDKQMDRHKTAILIKAAAVLKKRSQYDLALKCGINRKHLNEYLNRHIDLLPEQIERLIDELNLKEQAEQLSALAGGLE